MSRPFRSSVVPGYIELQRQTYPGKMELAKWEAQRLLDSLTGGMGDATAVRLLYRIAEQYGDVIIAAYQAMTDEERRDRNAPSTDPGSTIRP